MQYASLQLSSPTLPIRRGEDGLHRDHSPGLYGSSPFPVQVNRSIPTDFNKSCTRRHGCSSLCFDGPYAWLCLSADCFCKPETFCTNSANPLLITPLIINYRWISQKSIDQSIHQCVFNNNGFYIRTADLEVKGSLSYYQSLKPSFHVIGGAGFFTCSKQSPNSASSPRTSEGEIFWRSSFVWAAWAICNQVLTVFN